MQAVHLSDGESVDIVAESDIEAGDVVVRGELVLVATSPIAAGKSGGLRRRGGFAMAKKPGEEIELGTPVFWDADAGYVTAMQVHPEDQRAGVTFADAAADAETASVLLGA